MLYRLCHEKSCFLLMLKTKVSDQLHGNLAADQGLCFHYIDHTIHLFPKPLAISCGCKIGPGRKPQRQVFSRQGSYAVWSKLV